MQHFRFRRYLDFALILAIVFASASPACAFISGKTTLIEICTAAGLQMVEIAEKDAPTGDESGHETQPPCLFCFARTNIKAASDGTLPRFVSKKSQSPVFAITPKPFSPSRTLTPFAPRAPPAIS